MITNSENTQALHSASSLSIYEEWRDRLAHLAIFQSLLTARALRFFKSQLTVWANRFFKFQLYGMDFPLMVGGDRWASHIITLMRISPHLHYMRSVQECKQSNYTKRELFLHHFVNKSVLLPIIDHFSLSTVLANELYFAS